MTHAGYKFHFDPVRAEVALGSRMRVWIQVDGLIRPRLHARFAADTSVWIKIDDPVSTSVQRTCRTYLDTRRIVAMVATHHSEMPTDIGKLALLDEFHPGPEHADQNVVLFLARHRAGVASDTAVLIDYKCRSASGLPVHRNSSPISGIYRIRPVIHGHNPAPTPQTGYQSLCNRLINSGE